MTPEEFHCLALAIEDELFAANLKEVELRMARLIVKLSLRFGRTTTPQLRQKDFGLLAGIRETHVAETLGWLLGKKVIELEAPDVYRPNASPESWLTGERVTAAARSREAELLRDQAAPEMWRHSEIRAGDPRVAFPDAALQVSAENFRNPEVELPKSVSRNFRNSEVEETGTPPRARTRVRDMHVCMDGTKTSTTHNIHNMRDACYAPGGGGEEQQKGELQPRHHDLLEQIEELTASEGKSSDFLKTWEQRVQLDEVAAFKAISETRVAKREGRIKRSVGGALNWHFNHFRSARSR